LTIQTVNQLHNELLTAKTSVYDAFGLLLGADVDVNSLPRSITLDQLIYVQFAYCTAMLNVHTVLAYPWIRLSTGLCFDGKFRNDIIRASETVATVARRIIKMTEHINLKPHTPIA
jgi:hypothetical protein